MKLNCLDNCISTKYDYMRISIIICKPIMSNFDTIKAGVTIFGLTCRTV